MYIRFQRSKYITTILYNKYIIPRCFPIYYTVASWTRGFRIVIIILYEFADKTQYLCPVQDILGTGRRTSFRIYTRLKFIVFFSLSDTTSLYRRTGRRRYTHQNVFVRNARMYIYIPNLTISLYLAYQVYIYIYI